MRRKAGRGTQGRLVRSQAAALKGEEGVQKL